MANKAVWAAVLLACVGLCACGESPEPLTAGDFSSNPVQRTINGTPLSPDDQAGLVPERQARTAPPPKEDEPPTPGISQAVQEVVRPLEGVEAAGMPATLPSTLPGEVAAVAATGPSTLASTVPSFPSDQYVELGSVVAVVDAKPIYANKILRLDAPLYREYAQQMDMQHYEVAVRARIERVRDELIYDELEVAAALKSLDDKDKQMADALTARWRVQQIDEAGGSLGVARQKALAQGKTFEEAVEDHHRWLLQQIYYEKKISPRIQVSRIDMVKFYKEHQDDPRWGFTSHDSAHVQWIIMDPAHRDSSDLAHGREMALSEMNDLRQRALNGADFNGLTRFGDRGYPRDTTIERNTFVLKKVEATAFDMPVGQISSVIEDQGKFYLLKLIDRQVGNVQPFDDETVQDRITLELRKEQLSALREENRQRLLQDAIVSSTPDMIDRCVDMAMQNYQKWRAEK